VSLGQYLQSAQLLYTRISNTGLSKPTKAGIGFEMWVGNPHKLNPDAQD